MKLPNKRYNQLFGMLGMVGASLQIDNYQLSIPLIRQRHKIHSIYPNISPFATALNKYIKNEIKKSKLNTKTNIQKKLG